MTFFFKGRMSRSDQVCSKQINILCALAFALISCQLLVLTASGQEYAESTTPFMFEGDKSNEGQERRKLQPPSSTLNLSAPTKVELPDLSREEKKRLQPLVPYEFSLKILMLVQATYGFTLLADKWTDLIQARGCIKMEDFGAPICSATQSPSSTYPMLKRYKNKAYPFALFK